MAKYKGKNCNILSFDGRGMALVKFTDGTRLNVPASELNDKVESAPKDEKEDLEEVGLTSFKAGENATPDEE